MTNVLSLLQVDSVSREKCIPAAIGTERWAALTIWLLDV